MRKRARCREKAKQIKFPVRALDLLTGREGQRGGRRRGFGSHKTASLPLVVSWPTLPCQIRLILPLLPISTSWVTLVYFLCFPIVTSCAAFVYFLYRKAQLPSFPICISFFGTFQLPVPPSLCMLLFSLRAVVQLC